MNTPHYRLHVVEVLGEPAEMNKQTKHKAKCRTAKKTIWPEFIWTNDECELLLNMTHECKVQELMKETD